MKEKILTKVVGVQYHQGIDSIKENETVQVVKDTTSEFPQVLAVFNEAGEQVGNIVSNVNDFDLVVNGIVNNYELYDDVENYEFTVKRVAKYYVTLVGTLKENTNLSIEELEVIVANYKKSIHNMIAALYEAQSNHDVLFANHLKVLIDDAIKTHNENSNRLMQLKNELIVTKGNSTRVFDYYGASAK